MRFGLTVLNYVVTSNHIHLVVKDQDRGGIAAAMQLVAGRVGQEFSAESEQIQYPSWFFVGPTPPSYKKSDSAQPYDAESGEIPTHSLPGPQNRSE